MNRNELDEMIWLADDLEADDMPAVLATLISVRGSSYRPLGSMMLGGPSSAFVAGGVSGGCLEEYILRRGRTLNNRQPAALLRFVDDPRAGHADVPVLGCGSSIEVLLERFTSDHLTFLQRFAAVHDADHASFASCVIDTSTPSAVKVHRTLSTDADSMTNSDRQLSELQQQSLLSEFSVEGPIGPDVRALVHYICPSMRLVILGAGNDARPLCTLGRSMGWHVCVVDPRARLVTRSRFPDADQLVANDWWSALQSITITPRSAVVLMTHSLVDDAALLPLLVERPAAYLGVLGPERRRWLLDNVDTQMPESFASRLRGPIGLNLGDRSPNGIAVSIVSEILAELNGRTPAPLYRSNREELGALRT
jgi:xanthine dehydrogenase accessory factor